MDQQPTPFGPELRRRRLAARLSLTRLGQLVHYSKSQLSKVERGLKTPSPELARLCDTILNAQGALTTLAPARVPRPLPPPPPDEGETWLMHLTPGGPNWVQPLPRRHVMAAAGAASAVALGLGAPQAHAESATFLPAARSLFAHYRHLGQSAAPELLLPALVAQTHALRQLAARARAHTRDELLLLASRFAEYTGWLVQESGDDRGALWWTDKAVELAHAGGDHDLATYAVVRRALITFYRDDGPRTVQLAHRAQAASPPPRIAGLAAQQEAQGHALCGDHDACMRALDRARVLLERARTEEDTPVIGTTHLTDPVSMITGWCLHDLGAPARAAVLLDAQIARLPEGAVRTQVRYGVRQALAHAQAGEVEHACTLADRLLDRAGAVNSATVRTDLRRLARTLSRHPSHPAARELNHRLTASLSPADTDR